MLLTELVSDSSSEFFEGIPSREHDRLLGVLEICTEFTEGLHPFVKICCCELLRAKFEKGVEPDFDGVHLLMKFNEYCQSRAKECRNLLRIGFLDDIYDFVAGFLDSE